MTPREWINLAKRRVQRILTRRRFASHRQLEKKISEAGPSHMRPEPLKISAALSELVADGAVQSEPLPQLGTFYKPSDFGGPLDEARRLEIVDLYQRFRELTSNSQVCGKALERIVHQATFATDRYTVLGTPDYPPAQGFAINGYVLDRECDHILIPKDFHGPKVVVEDKNLREWLHPSSQEVWAVVGRALRIPNAVPVLICRRMHYIGFSFFKYIGMACWQVYCQYFSPSVEDNLLRIRHTDGLGFSDVSTSIDPPSALVRFFQRTIPNNLKTFQARFEDYRPVLHHYAIDERLEDEGIRGAARNKLFEEFKETLPRREDPSDFPPEGYTLPEDEGKNEE